MDKKLLRENIKARGDAGQIGLTEILLKTGRVMGPFPTGSDGRWGLWSDTKGGQILKVGILADLI